MTVNLKCGARGAERALIGLRMGGVGTEILNDIRQIPLRQLERHDETTTRINDSVH